MNSVPQEIIRAYRQARKLPGMTARGAWNVAKEARIASPFVWEDANYKLSVKQAVVERDGFTCFLQVEYDIDHDWCDGRGQFTDTWEEGAVKNPYWVRSGHNTFQYFIPEVSIADHRKALQAMGYSRSQAQELAEYYVREDARIAADPAMAGYGVYGVTVTVCKNGIELGEDSCWGIELDDPDDCHLDEVAQECLDAALSEAKKNLQQLRGWK